MASYTATIATHRTLAANVADTVTLADHHDSVEVLNRGSVDLWARADGSAPVIGADDCVIIPAGSAATMRTKGASTVVQLIAAAICAYSVTGTDA